MSAISAACPITAGAVAAGGVAPGGVAGQPPGTLIRAARLPASLWPPNTDAAHRIAYYSAGVSGRPHLVTGAVYLPDGDADGNDWPVVSYAHGTTGRSDAWVPSLTGLPWPEREHIGCWLDRGFAVVSTDYEGLGCGGGDRCRDSKREARNIIDIVRAARQLDYPLGRSWIVVGFAQGAHAALRAAQVAGSYAPDLDFRACVALPPARRA
jgi:dipeptidyl aminopeptidase/acylaminoacyl peptidase